LLINLTDICVGDFWMTNDRLESMSSMTDQVRFATSFHEDHTVAIIDSSRPNSRLNLNMQSGSTDNGWDLSRATKPFDTFTGYLWGVIFGIFVLNVAAYYLVERPAARGGARVQKPSESEGLPVTEASGAESDPGALTMYHTFGLFANSLQETAIAPSCWAGQVIKAGWTVFLFIVISFWSATLTSTMVVNSVAAIDERTLGNALENEKVCAHGYLYQALREETVDLPYPDTLWDKQKVKNNLVRMGRWRGDYPDSMYGSLMALKEGYCDIVMGIDGQFSAARASNGSFCSLKVEASQTSLIEPAAVGIPVRAELEPAMSYLIRDIKGAYRTSFEEDLLANWINPECPNAKLIQAEESSGSMSRVLSRIGVQDMLMPLICTMACALSAVAFFTFMRTHRLAANWQRPH